MRRFWEKVEKEPGCWLWRGYVDHTGYGKFMVPTGRGQRASRAHRVAYELAVGPIPAGMQLDHLCRVRHCVNPAHLEVVTARENLRRGRTVNARNAAKTHCPAGHPYTRRSGRGFRICQACKTASERRRLARKAARA